MRVEGPKRFILLQPTNAVAILPWVQLAALGSPVVPLVKMRSAESCQVMPFLHSSPILSPLISASFSLVSSCAPAISSRGKRQDESCHWTKLRLGSDLRRRGRASRTGAARSES